MASLSSRSNSPLQLRPFRPKLPLPSPAQNLMRSTKTSHSPLLLVVLQTDAPAKKRKCLSTSPFLRPRTPRLTLRPHSLNPRPRNTPVSTPSLPWTNAAYPGSTLRISTDCSPVNIFGQLPNPIEPCNKVPSFIHNQWHCSQKGNKI